MSYYQYLQRKSVLLVIWFMLNGLALFINYFKMEGEIRNREFMSSYKNSRYFTNIKSQYNYNPEDAFSPHSFTEFWPFVTFSEKISEYEFSSPKRFNGVFYNYDISEFIAYSILIFIILFFVYEFKKDKKQQPQI